uniref:Uncharacterized protein n=1 Tax=Plectus sambesii TaxID=2011161 RepID=A0A914WH44_9BILA
MKTVDQCTRSLAWWLISELDWWGIEAPLVAMLCSLCCSIVLLVPLYYVLRYIWELFVIGDLQNKPVFITGCDSGFGRQLALKLASNGIPVFAGCLTEKGEDSLRKDSQGLQGKLQTVALDVTNDESVVKAAETVKNSLKGKDLWAVVNNAGIFSIYGPDDWCTIDEYRRSIDVNLLGVIRVSQAFKPFVKKSKGRIVTVSSVAGRYTSACTGPYSTAKYAVESYMDAIR